MTKKEFLSVSESGDQKNKWELYSWDFGGIRTLFLDEPYVRMFFFTFAWLCCGILSSLNLKLWRHAFLGPDFWLCVVQGLFFFAAGQPGMKWCVEHGFHRSFFQGEMFLLEQLLDSYTFIHIRTHSYFLLELIHGSVVLEPRFHGLWSRSQGPIDQQIVSDDHNIPSCVGSKDLNYVYWSHLFVVYSPLVDQRKKSVLLMVSSPFLSTPYDSLMFISVLMKFTSSSQFWIALFLNNKWFFHPINNRINKHK